MAFKQGVPSLTKTRPRYAPKARFRMFAVFYFQRTIKSLRKSSLY